MTDLEDGRTDAAEREFSKALIALFKGPVYRDTHERAWSTLLSQRARVREHVAALGLEEYLDENEGYAFLRTTDVADEEDPLPRLVPRHRLSFALSLLLALLRRRLLEHDATAGDTKLVLTREQVCEMMLTFIGGGSNEARLLDQVDTQLKKAADLGFLRRVKADEPAYEVRRILAAFVDAQWLSELDEKLASYARKVTDDDPTGSETQ